jgi:hypothetical protein
MEKKGSKPDKNPETSTKNAVQELHLRALMVRKYQQHR